LETNRKEHDVYEDEEMGEQTTVVEKESADNSEPEDNDQGDIHGDVQGEISNNVEDLELDDDEPAVLGVTDPVFQDSVLAANGVYLNLPHIKSVHPLFILKLLTLCHSGYW
jgi:hypothetical protein